MMQEEQEWIERCRNGDREAFYKLVEPLLDRVYSASAAILRSSHLAEDAVQNALIEAYRAIMNGKEIRNFTGWFKHLCAMRAIDLARKRSRLNRMTEGLEHLEPVDQGAQPIDALLKKEEQHSLLSQVMSLDIQHRSVVLLFYYQEMSIEEIAATLGVKEGTVKSRLHRARHKLLKLYQSNGNRKVMMNAGYKD
ncbi:RNA polymerase sigma factor [Paenibacillus macerans]|uniref:RNA polymerase sigma factor, sigma-70 family protein n=2 Tax=Paenibacillus macerans TaxID=44252 RepID=A0A090YLT2_PAEMA|nr:RNA polymerase sigma factor [Paenibacillus macerans]KFM93070.1 RNA polymerase sigma factor, sigma-70 family protein [Paenibacillus macerans]MCY7559219.1 RNA polymerase sigma factor [Paenibacillus macerans]MDU5949558.1 RNA polymerase sigma factor [Paenibacillus macerans]MEC0149201.1 RNA polymerase sigma factor [Paenibacillus macerans]SUA84671.1 RNA polymerase sigma-H factor Sigma-30 [Paenibacillus macerans]